MTEDQAELLAAARDAVRAARIVIKEGLPGFAASRSYYAMFYVAQAFLLKKELAFSKHTGTISAFGKEFCSTGEIPTEFHRALLAAHKYRTKADYTKGHTVDPVIAEQQIEHAQKFITLAEQMLGPVSDE